MIAATVGIHCPAQRSVAEVQMHETAQQGAGKPGHLFGTRQRYRLRRPWKLPEKVRCHPTGWPAS
jgi:hypothetical protein